VRLYPTSRPGLTRRPWSDRANRQRRRLGRLILHQLLGRQRNSALCAYLLILALLGFMQQRFRYCRQRTAFRTATFLRYFPTLLAEGDMCEIACTEGARRVCGVGPSNASGSDLSSAARAEPLALADFPQVARAIASPRGG